MVENRRFESCRQAGVLISGLFERIGSTRLWQNHRFRAAARLESLSRVSLRESEAPRLLFNHKIARFRGAAWLKTAVSLRAAARLQNPYLGSL